MFKSLYSDKCNPIFLKATNDERGRDDLVNLFISMVQYVVKTFNFIELFTNYTLKGEYFEHI